MKQVFTTGVLALTLLVSAQTVMAEGTLARIVCPQWFDGKEEGIIVVLDQLSTAYKDGEEVKHMQGAEFVREPFDGRSPIFEARLWRFDGFLQLDGDPRLEDINAMVEEGVPTAEWIGQMERLSGSIGFSYGHNLDGDSRVNFIISSLNNWKGLFSRTISGQEMPTKVKCTQPYFVPME